MSEQFIIHVNNAGAITNRNTLTKELSSLKAGSYFVKIENTRKRSNPQNRYYWAVVIPLMQKGFEDLGHELSKEETHDFIKAKFNSIDVVNKETGEAVTVPMSTTKLTKEDFAGYIEKIQRWSSEFLGIVIPDPGQQIEIYE